MNSHEYKTTSDAKQSYFERVQSRIIRRKLWRKIGLWLLVYLAGIAFTAAVFYFGQKLDGVGR